MFVLPKIVVIIFGIEQIEVEIKDKYAKVLVMALVFFPGTPHKILLLKCKNPKTKHKLTIS